MSGRAATTSGRTLSRPHARTNPVLKNVYAPPASPGIRAALEASDPGRVNTDSWKGR